MTTSTVRTVRSCSNAVERCSSFKKVRCTKPSITESLSDPVLVDVVPHCNNSACPTAVGAWKLCWPFYCIGTSLSSFPTRCVEDMSAGEPTYSMPMLESLVTDRTCIVHAFIDHRHHWSWCWCGFGVTTFRLRCTLRFCLWLRWISRWRWCWWWFNIWRTRVGACTCPVGPLCHQGYGLCHSVK